MNPSEIDILVDLIKRMTGVLAILVKLESDFLEEPETPETVFEKLNPLLEQRDLALEEMKNIERQLTDRFGQTCRKGFSSIIKELKLQEPVLESPALEYEKTLSRLAEQDRLVEEKLRNFRKDLADEVKKIRRGTRQLKGYFQNDTTGSCFIDKVK